MHRFAADSRADLGSAIRRKMNPSLDLGPKLAVDDFVAREASKNHAEHQIPSGFPEGAEKHD